MARLFAQIWRWLRFIWEWLGHLALIQWLAGHFWSLAIAMIVGLAAAIWGVIKSEPVLWIPAAACACLATLLSLAIFLRVRDGWRRRAHRGTAEHEPSFDWRSVSDAFDEFCDPAIVAQRRQYVESYEKASLRMFDYDDQMNKLLPGLPAEVEKYNHLSRQREAFGSAARAAEQGLNIVWDKLGAEMDMMLRSGKIVAQGFREPHTGGNAEVMISAPEWRILELVPSDSTAINKLSSSVIYSGIQLARALTAAAP